MKRKKILHPAAACCRNRLSAWEKRTFPRAGADGFALVAALMFLVILSVIGVSATSTTTVEHLISTNDRVTKEAFYEAEGGIEVGIEMVRQNVICAEGFKTNRNAGTSEESLQVNGVEILDPLFWDQDIIDDQAELAQYPDDAVGYRDIVIPARDPSDQDSENRTNLAFFGEVRLPNGDCVSMSSAYEGLGASLPSGAYLAFEIHSQRIGQKSSVSVHAQQWLQKIDEQGDCEYGEL